MKKIQRGKAFCCKPTQSQQGSEKGEEKELRGGGLARQRFVDAGGRQRKGERRFRCSMETGAEFNSWKKSKDGHEVGRGGGTGSKTEK